MLKIEKIGLVELDMAEEEMSLSGEQSDLSDYVNDEGGIWSLRQVEKIRGWTVSYTHLTLPTICSV